MNVLAPFASMTHGRDNAFKRQLAIVGTVIGVLQVALGVEVIVAALRLLGVVGRGHG